MKSIVSFLIAVAVCSALFFAVDVVFMKAQGLKLFPDKAETKASH
jgi:hypothetical protein